MFCKTENVFTKVEIILIIILINISFITNAPISGSEELCSVSLVPNELIAKRFQESVITIRCEAFVSHRLSDLSFQFQNPVFDLSFGGAPRTGVFILRGNTTCDQKRTKCWSEYKIAANNIGHLIQHSGNIIYSCQVADQLRNGTASSQARCESKGTLGFSKTLKYGDSCAPSNTDQECDQRMDCGPPETENETEDDFQCNCVTGFTAIPLPFRNTLCLEEVSLGLVCNYTKQCSAVDSNAICDYNPSLGLRVCKCNEESIEFTEYKTDYIKKCKIKPKTTVNITTMSTTDEEEVTEITTIIAKVDEIVSKKSLDIKEDKDFQTTRKNTSSGSLGFILFFVAILLAILIVVLIIRVRNKSDKMVLNKRTTEQQTDDNDGEQTDPMLTTENNGMDEVDDTTKETDSANNDNQSAQQIRNNINDSQKTQTNV